MANHRSTVNEIVARCRRVGWQVEMSDGPSEWLFKIHTPPPHRAAYVHKTPSDVNWSRVLLRQLNAAGLSKAEKALNEKVAAERKAALDEQRAKADAKATQMAAKARREAAALAAAAGPYAGPEEFDPAWLLTPHPFPETRTGILTPQTAALVLEKSNTSNRKRSDARVEYFESLINRDRFLATHQGGAHDSNGVLQDGQSRAEAVVRAGKPVVLQWSVGMPPENFSALDCGGQRTGRDTAYVMGEEDPGAMAAAAKVLAIIDRWGLDAYRKSKNRMPNDQVAVAIRSYGDDLRKAIAIAKDIRKQVKRASLSSLSAAIFLIDRQLPEGDPRVTRFFEDLRFGLDGRKYSTDPVYRLRQALLDGPADARRHYDQFEQVALVIKSWNLRATGQGRKTLSWRRDHDFPAPFLPPPLADDEHFQALEAGTA